MCHIALVHNHEWTLFVVATFPSEKRSLHSFTQNCQLAPHTPYVHSMRIVSVGFGWVIFNKLL